MTSKIFSSAFSQEKDWQRGTEELIAKVQKDLEGASCDLALFFVSEGYANINPLLLAGLLKEKLVCSVLLGCNASGIIGTDREIEFEPALSILAMHLPNAKILPFSMSAFEANRLEKGEDLVRQLDLYPTDRPHFILLADPASCNAEGVLRAFNEGYPKRPVIGGLTSGAATGGSNWLSLNGEIFEEGAAGVALGGDVSFDVIVSQGCRPIGKPFIITKAEHNVLRELAGKPAIQILQEVYDALPMADKELARHSLFTGLVMDEHQHSFERGDFLIRNIMRMDQKTRSLEIGAELKTGQTLQFQLRDAQTSAEDLQVLLGKSDPLKANRPCGALLVSCCGRGKGLYGEENHDVRMIQSKKGPIPLTGFFANGEIGPVDQKNYLHGYTSSLAIIH